LSDIYDVGSRQHRPGSAAARVAKSGALLNCRGAECLRDVHMIPCASDKLQGQVTGILCVPIVGHTGQVIGVIEVRTVEV